MSKRLPRRFIPALIVAAVVLAMPAMVNFSEFILDILIKVGITVVLVASLRVSFSTGIWNVGQAGFYAVGAYAIYFLLTLTGIPCWVGIPMVGLGAAGIAWGLGSITLRAKGIYFCLISLAFVEVVRLTVVHTIGSVHHITMVPQPDPIVIPYLTIIDFTTRLDYYYSMLVLVIISLLLLYRLDRSRFGTTFKAIQQGGALAESVGINVMRFETLAFAISSFFAGMAGGFFAVSNMCIAPQGFTVWHSILLVFITIVGGTESLWGPVVGAIVLVILPEFLPAGALRWIFYASLALVILLLLPKGLISLPEAIRSRKSKPKLQKGG